MVMADHGADVIKIEPYHEGEPVRHIGLSQPGSEHTVWFRNTHRGKRSLKLDLKQPQGRDLLLSLVAKADVFVEAFRPGVMDRLGLDYDTLSAINPGLVYCSISAFGQTGPYRDKPAHDLAVEALAGIVALNLGQDGLPTNPALTAADMIASSMALSAILMALFARTRSGRGDFIDVSLYDALLSWTPNITGSVFGADRAPDVKQERIWGGTAFYHLYETADGAWLALGGSEIKFAINLLTALGRPDLIDACREPPGAAQVPVKDFLADCFRRQPMAYWQDYLAKIDLCWAPVRTLKEAFDDPATMARGMRIKDDQGFDHIGIPIKFRDEPGQINAHVPHFGADSYEIASECDYSPDEIAELINKKII
jgi:crotonobetainyl-CoA:carnitine CoA-transferase CaiB-like acyl-CoA transferase